MSFDQEPEYPHPCSVECQRFEQKCSKKRCASMDDCEDFLLKKPEAQSDIGERSQ